MHNERIYERRQATERTAAVMFIASGGGVLAAIFAFFQGGWLPGIAFLILAAIAFAISEVLSLLGDILAKRDGLENKGAAGAKPAETEAKGL